MSTVQYKYNSTGVTGWQWCVQEEEIERKLVATRSKRRICSRCGGRPVYMPRIPTMDWCEPCIWEFVGAPEEAIIMPVQTLFSKSEI